MSAPQANRNAAKARTGVQVNFYLNLKDAEAIRRKLEQAGEDVSVEAIRCHARNYAKNGIALMLRGKCDVEGCIWAVEVECRIGKCAPLTRYCSSHYMQFHLPEDEDREQEEIEIGGEGNGEARSKGGLNSSLDLPPAEEQA